MILIEVKTIMTRKFDKYSEMMPVYCMDCPA